MSSSWVLASSFASVSSIDFLSLSFFFEESVFFILFIFYFSSSSISKLNATLFTLLAWLFFSFLFFCIFLHLVLFSSFNPPRAGVVVPGRFVSRVSRLRSRPRDQSRTPNRLKG